jgi:hypothetical protein
MSTTILDIAAFRPPAPPASGRPGRGSAGRAIGYRGGPLPGLPSRAAPGRGGWGAALARWLAERPRDMPPRG